MQVLDNKADSIFFFSHHPTEKFMESSGREVRMTLEKFSRSGSESSGIGTKYLEAPATRVMLGNPRRDNTSILPLAG